MSDLADELEDLSLLYKANLINKKEYERIKAQMLDNSSKNREIFYSMKTSPSELIKLKNLLNDGSLTLEEFELQKNKLTKSSRYLDTFINKKSRKKLIALQLCLFLLGSLFIYQGNVYASCANSKYLNNLEFSKKTTESIYYQVATRVNEFRLNNHYEKWNKDNPFPDPNDLDDSLNSSQWKIEYDKQMDTYAKAKEEAGQKFHKNQLNEYFSSQTFINSWYVKCIINEVNKRQDKDSIIALEETHYAAYTIWYVNAMWYGKDIFN